MNIDEPKARVKSMCCQTRQKRLLATSPVDETLTLEMHTLHLSSSFVFGSFRSGPTCKLNVNALVQCLSC